MKVQLPWFGKAAGSSAGTIYQSYWGKTYTRSFPFSFHYPDTQRQQKCQATFFDIQRTWLPIYQQVSQSIGPMQRKNKNPFNSMMRNIFRVFNPYGKYYTGHIPEFFGLDPKNRVRPVLLDINLDINPDDVVLTYDMARPYNGLQIRLVKSYLLLFNITQQTMLFSEEPFRPDVQRVTFENTLGWLPSDDYAFYVALAADNWLGNFNLCVL